MASNIVAFIGMDNFDNIIYLSRILFKLGKKVLIIDHSEVMSIKYSIPQPEGISCDDEIITYRHVDFTTMEVNQEMISNYNDILIFYGFREPIADIAFCNRLVFVTDLFQNNQERIRDLIHHIKFTEHVAVEILIKDIIDMKISPNIIAESLSEYLPQMEVSNLYFDEKDYLNGLSCHYNDNVRFVHLSKIRKQYLLKEIMNIYPQIDTKHLTTAFHRARRGK